MLGSMRLAPSSKTSNTRVFAIAGSASGVDNAGTYTGKNLTGCFLLRESKDTVLQPGITQGSK